MWFSENIFFGPITYSLLACNLHGKEGDLNNVKYMIVPLRCQKLCKDASVKSSPLDEQCDVLPQSRSCLKERLCRFQMSTVMCLYNRSCTKSTTNEPNVGASIGMLRSHDWSSTLHWVAPPLPRQRFFSVDFATSLPLLSRSSCFSKLDFGVRWLVVQTFSPVLNRKCFKWLKTFFSPSQVWFWSAMKGCSSRFIVSFM